MYVLIWLRRHGTTHVMLGVKGGSHASCLKGWCQAAYVCTHWTWALQWLQIRTMAFDCCHSELRPMLFASADCKCCWQVYTIWHYFMHPLHMCVICECLCTCRWAGLNMHACASRCCVVCVCRQVLLASIMLCVHCTCLSDVYWSVCSPSLWRSEFESRWGSIVFLPWNCF